MEIKELLKLAALHLIAAMAVYLLIFLLGGLRPILGWLIIFAAIVFIIGRRRKTRYSCWLDKTIGKLWSILPRFGGRRQK